MNDDKINSKRRSVLNWLIAGGVVVWGGGIIATVIQYLIPPKTLDAKLKVVPLGNNNNIPPNTSLRFKFGNKPGIFIKTRDGQLKAFISKCTHLDCIVEYQADNKIFFCNCHGGKFDINGINIAGPPPRPLAELGVKLKKGKVFIIEKKV